jgi:polysaccharide export outer membrane protein
MQVDYADVKIAPGDVISISTYGVPELTTSGQTSTGTIFNANPGMVQGIKVGATGDVVLPYLGTVRLAGLTISEAAAYLKNALKDGGYLTDPQVSVGFVDSPTRAITVLGEVMKPSPVPAHGQIRLLDVISACGGFTPLASHTITIKRNGSADAITVELGADPTAAGTINIPLLPGDTVLVSKVGSIFVLGQVKTPSAIPLGYNSPITVLRALAMAGGVNYGAALSKARIIRTNADSQHIEILLDLKKIMFGKQQDVALRSDDVLFIPSNAFKASMAAGGASIAVSAFYAAALLR